MSSKKIKKTFDAGELVTEYVDPKLLYANPWNSNETDMLADAKIKNSLKKFGFVRPMMVRELDDGTLQLLGGQHRCEKAIELKMEKVPIQNLGTVDDTTARELSLIDNSRYGEDNPEKLFKVIEFIKNNDDVDLSDYLVYDEEAMACFSSDNELEWGNTFPEEDDMNPSKDDKPVEPIDMPEKVYLVVVKCGSEQDQQTVYDLNTAKGYTCTVQSM